MGLRDNYEHVQERIRRAAVQAGRDPAEITLVAVTKKFGVEVMREAYDIGMRVFGENYVQEFEGKYPQVAGLTGARFHLIGHLQSNKARKAADMFHAIQTVDSAKLAARLDSMERPMDVMIEVKLSEEDAKHGAEPESLPEIIGAVQASKHLRMLGLMTMPPWSDDPEAARPYFKQLKQLAGQHGLKGLSMGMSHDLEAAIEEGATHVRVGTALFGKRPKPAA